MRKRAVVLTAIAVALFQLPLFAVPEPQSVKLRFNPSDVSNFEVGFSYSDENPSSEEITAVVPLQIADDGYGRPAKAIYVYWTISTSEPFSITLENDESCNFPLSFSWEGKSEESNVIESSAGGAFYGKSNAVALDISTEVPVSDLEIEDYTGRLILTISGDEA